MIAEPPSALALFIRRIMDAREQRKRQAHGRGTVDGGKLIVTEEIRSLPAPRDMPAQSSALKSSTPLALRSSDILAMPDRDHLRRVVPDEHFVDWEEGAQMARRVRGNKVTGRRSR